MPKKMDPQLSDKFFVDFDPVSRKQWEEIIKKDLNGADYRKKLRWDTPEGFSVLPFYMKDDLDSLNHLDSLPGQYPYVRGTRQTGTWNITEDVTASGLEDTRRLSQQAVEAGSDTLFIFMDAAPNEGMLGGDLYGVPLQNQGDMKILLKGLDLEKVSLYFDGGIATPLLLGMFINEMESRSIEPTRRTAVFHYDPLTWGARHGRWPNTEGKTASMVAELSRLPYRTLGIDGTFYHHCGSSIVQELGTALAIGSEYLAIASGREIPISEAVNSIHMRLSAGSLYFPEIAKFRAARLLWSKLVSAYDPEAGKEAKLFILAETSPWNKTISDPYNNILRATTEAMAAGSGNADAIRIAPLDNRFQIPASFSRRIARNIHHILRHESGFHKVADPAAGSFYIEQLTDKIAAESWDFFRFLEKQGGFIKALEGRFLQLAIEETHRNKRSAIRKRKQVFVGTNHYPDPGEKIPDDPYILRPVHSLKQTGYDELPDSTIPAIKKAFAGGANTGDVLDAVFDVQKQLYPSLESWHGPEEFEHLKIRTTEIRNKTGRMPVAALLPVGDKKIRNARASFAKNFLGTAGFEVHEKPGYDSISNALEQIGPLKPEMIVLCSSDQEYPELVEMLSTLAHKVKKTNPLLILAGKPGTSEQIYRKAGIDYFIHTGSDMVEILNEIQRDLEDRLL